MINTAKIVGSTFPDPPKQQPYKWGRRDTGRWASVPYEGLDQNGIDVLAAGADALGLTYSAENSFGAKSRVTIEYPYNNISSYGQTAQTEIATAWELIPKNELIPLLDSRNPLVVSAIQAEVTLLNQWNKAGTLSTFITDGNGNFIQPINTSGGGAGIVFSQAGTILAKYMYDGVLQVEIPAPTITYTSTVTSQYINPARFTNLGKILSNATLTASYGIPTSILFVMPTFSDPSPIPIAGGYYQTLLYGWLIKSPSVRQLTRQKWSISQSFDYGLWGIDLYGGTRL